MQPLENLDGVCSLHQTYLTSMIMLLFVW